MDWYTKQQQQQKELLLVRQAALQEEERDGGSGEDVVPGDSVSNQGEVVPEEGTDDQKLKRLSTAERKQDNEMFTVAGVSSATKTRPGSAEVLLATEAQ